MRRYAIFDSTGVAREILRTDGQWPFHPEFPHMELTDESDELVLGARREGERWVKVPDPLPPPPSRSPAVQPVEPPRLLAPPRVVRTVPRAAIEELGYFGNIWLRKLYFAKAGDQHPGHRHQHDHVSILAQGSVAVRVEDVETQYHAPAWIVVRKDREHTITALADETVWWCLYALRDADGQPLDIFDPERHDPLGIT